MIDGLDESGTQAEFARVVGVTQSVVSELIARGVLTKGDTMGAWIIAYCRNLREHAAGRATTGELVLADERARLASEQADRVAMENAVRRRELAPVTLLTTTLARVSRQVVGIIESVPPQLRRRSKHLTAADIDFIVGELARARNLAAAITIEDADDGYGSDRGSDPIGAQTA